MNTEIWTRLTALTETRALAAKAELDWQTFLKSLVANGEKGPFVNSEGADKWIYPVKGGSLCLTNKRSGPGKGKRKAKEEVPED